MQTSPYYSWDADILIMKQRKISTLISEKFSMGGGVHDNSVCDKSTQNHNEMTVHRTGSKSFEEF